MTISVVGVGNAAGQSAGTAGSASTVSVTPTRNASSASGDRIYVVVGANNTSATTPANWTAVFKDTVVGTGAVSAGGGQRYLSVYYRDYDGVWTMPAFTLTSAAQNDQTIACITLRKSATDTWDTPTISSTATYFGTAGTAFTATTATMGVTGSGVGQDFSTLLACSVFNDNVTMTGGTLTGTNGFTSGTVTERVDGGSATGNDVSLKLHTAHPTQGNSPNGTLTHAGTLSAASQGGVIVVQQLAVPVKIETVTQDFNSGLPGADWFATGGVSADTGAVKLTHGVGADYQNYIYVPCTDLTASAAFVEVKDYGNQAFANHYVQVSTASADNAGGGKNVMFLAQTNILRAFQIVAGAYTQIGSNLTLSLTDHRWLRIREASGTVFWDTSPNGTAPSWTNRWSTANPFPVTAMQFALECSVNAADGVSFAIFDNYNVAGTAAATPTINYRYPSLAVHRASIY